MKKVQSNSRRHSNSPLYLISTVGCTPARIGELVASLPVGNWIYLGSDTLFRMRLEQALHGRAPVRQIGDALESVSRRLRADFLEAIGKLAVENSSPLWWSTKLASKDPNRSPLYLHACLMRVGRDLLRQGKGPGTAFLIESPAVWSHLRAFARRRGIPVRPVKSRLRHLRRFLAQSARGAWRHLWIWRRFISRRRELKRRGLLSIPAFSGGNTALLFTWADRRNVTPAGTYRDPHLGVLPGHLHARGYRITYVPAVLHTVPFGEVVDRLRETGERFVFPEAALSPGDLSRCIAQAFRYRPRVRRPLSLDGMDISGLVREQVSEERNSSSHATALTYYHLMRRLKQAGVEPGRIFHTFEGHNWSRAMCLGARTYMPRVEITAFENLIFTPMLLSGYTSPSELRCLPLPDRIVTNGPLFASVLRREGYPPERVVAGAAIRHAYLWDLPRATAPPLCNATTRVLVATGIDFADSVELAAKALMAFSGRAGYRVLVKCHPVVDRRRVEAELGAEARAANVQFTEMPLEDLLPQVHVLLYTYTSVCFEALRHGVPPIFVHSENWLCMDQLDRTPECRWAARTPEEVRRVTSEIMRMSNGTWNRWYAHAQQSLQQSLAPVTSGRLDRFIAPNGSHLSGLHRDFGNAALEPSSGGRL